VPQAGQKLEFEAALNWQFGHNIGGCDKFGLSVYVWGGR